ncbi:MAG TPA: hypothetical protein VNZ49_07210 [Bacteroidia bacterium]|jgi:hypothetical protein|nr:hypothetical protein [Bacteroidia bacterium]
MPIIKSTEELMEKMRLLVEKGEEDNVIESKLEEDGIEGDRTERLMLYANAYRKLYKKRIAVIQIIFWILVIMAMTIIELVIMSKSFILEGTILVTSLHQIVSGIIKYYRA